MQFKIFKKISEKQKCKNKEDNLIPKFHSKRRVGSDRNATVEKGHRFFGLFIYSLACGRGPMEKMIN